MRSASLHKHHGGCHCGNIRIVVEFSTAPAQTPLRACQCSFCRAHGVRSASDPAGSFSVWAQDWSEVTRYRFGTKTADVLLCRKCGVYVGAVTETPAGLLGVVNVNALVDQSAFTMAPERSDFGAEEPEGRVVDRQARRAKRWMPAKLHA
jgi:hypothetical protein